MRLQPVFDYPISLAMSHIFYRVFEFLSVMVRLVLALNALFPMGPDRQVPTEDSDFPDRCEICGWLSVPACREIIAFRPAAFGVRVRRSNDLSIGRLGRYERARHRIAGNWRGPC